MVPCDATDDAREKDEIYIILALNGLVERNISATHLLTH